MAETAESAPAEIEGKAMDGNATILLVEDEKPILRLAMKILTQRGYQVIAAGSPALAIDLVQKFPGPIHLLITDVVMPEMNGKELSGKIAALRPGIKTLYMSGYTADIIARDGVIEEGTQFLQKPFSAKSLAQKTAEVLEEIP